jgi:hypothetical protein
MKIWNVVDPRFMTLQRILVVKIHAPLKVSEVAVELTVSTAKNFKNVVAAALVVEIAAVETWHIGLMSILAAHLMAKTNFIEEPVNHVAELASIIQQLIHVVAPPFTNQNHAHLTAVEI